MDTNENRRAEDAERLPAEKLEWETPSQPSRFGSPEMQALIAANFAAPAVDAAKLTKDEKDSLMVKVKGYMQVVDLRRLLLQHEKCETEEAEIFANINALIAKRVPDALPVDAAELGKLVALAEKATPGPWTWEIAGEESLNMAVLRGANNVRVCDFGVGDNHDPAEGTEPDAADMAFMIAANPAAILRIAALVVQQAARIAELEAREGVLMPRKMNAEQRSILKEAAPKWNSDSIYSGLLAASEDK